MSLERRPKRHPDTAFRDFDEEGGLVVLSGRAEIKVLNAVGTTVFKCLDGEHTVGEIVDRVADEYGVDAATAAADVEAFLDDLAKHGMLDEAATIQESTA